MKTTSVLLKGHFDVDRLKADLEKATARFKSAPQIGKYHDGSWTGIGLRNFSGDYSNTLAAHTGHSKDTEVLKQCDYFRKILNDLGFPVYVARLLFLPPGKVIGEHTDPGFGWKHGMFRLHIPIITDPGVEFNIGEDSVYWQPGEFWFGDFSQPHSLHNRSQITRVHLVLDCPITEASLALFPQTFLEHVARQEDILVLKPLAIEDSELQKYTGTLVVKGPLLGLNVPISATVSVSDGMLAVKVRGIPLVYHFSAVGNHGFQCNTYELQWPGELTSDTNVRVLYRDLKTGKTQDVVVYRKQPFGVWAFSWVQRTLVGSVWNGYFGLLRIKRFFTGNKHTVEPTKEFYT